MNTRSSRSGDMPAPRHVTGISGAIQQRLMAIMNASPTLFSLKDTAGRYLFVNPRFEAAFGVRAEWVLGRTDEQIFPSRLAEEFRRRDLEALQTNQAVESEESMPMLDGERILRTVRFPLPGDDGVVDAVCTQAVDVTERTQAENQLRLAARVFDHSGEGIMITDAQVRILTVNDAFKRVTGYTEREAIGQSPALLASGRHGPEFYQNMWDSIEHRGWWQGEVWNRRKNGEIYAEWLTINCVRDADGRVCNYVGIFSDITVVRESQQRIEYLATHDELTGLPNRALYLDRLKQAIGKAGRNQSKVAVLFVDVDNFKLVNDNLGHDVGDLLLREVAERLKGCVRIGDTVSRFGGDEFTIILETDTLDEVTGCAERIVRLLSQSHQLDGKQVYATASIGISLYPDDGDDAQTLMKHADIAMYRAKEGGRNNFQFFTGELKAMSQERMALTHDLRLALDSGDFHLVYQPQVEMASGRLVGLEALLRWTHPERGPVGPDRFIPLAEEIGLVGAIGEWVLNAVCRQIAAWRAQGLRVPRVAINLSSQQFRKDDVPEMVENVLAEHGVAPAQLAIEITEHALLDDTGHVQAMLDRLKQLGLHLSVDDFGTGYSSLSYLKRYPIDTIKIDRSFVDGIADEVHDRAIACAIIALAGALGMDVLAEGVETVAQRDTLLGAGCRLAQGYLFARPLPVGQVEGMLRPDRAAEAAAVS